MERRRFIAAGMMAGLATSVAARAEEAGHHHGHDHGAAADGAHDHPPLYAPLSAASAHCVETGNNCLRHCLGMVAMKDTSMVSCMTSVHDLIAACGALQAIAAVNSPHTRVMARAVAEICTACETECGKFPDIAECRACRDSCKACAAECKKIAA